MKDHGSVISRRATLLVATTASFIIPFAGSSIVIGLPPISREFALDAVTLGWVPTSFILTVAVMLVPFGRIADIHGRKKVFVLGAIIYTTSSLLAAFSASALMLIAFRVAQGIGGAMLMGTGPAILMSVFPITERGRVLGINVASVYIGLSLGPVLGGFLTQYFGWRSLFLVTALFGLVIIAVALWKLRGEWAEAAGEKFDLVGSVIYAIAMVTLIYGLSLLPKLAGAWLMVVSVLGIMAFIRWEMRVKTPVLHIGLFKHNTVFSLSNLSALISYSATFAVGFLLSLYLQSIRGFEPQPTGLILVSQPIVMALLSPLAGRLSDRIEPRLIASAGMAVTTLGLVILIFLGQGTGLGPVLVSLVILGLGLALFSAPNTNAVMSSVDKRFYGVAAGTLGTMRSIGQMLSLGIVMLLFSIYAGELQIASANSPLFLESMRVAFIIFSALGFVGIFASLARGRVR